MVKGRFRGERLQVERLTPRLGERYGEEGADPGWGGGLVEVGVRVGEGWWWGSGTRCLVRPAL